MHIELSDDPTSFRTRDWTGVVRADPSGTFFHTPAYLKLWWEEFGTGSPILALAEDEGKVVGACALECIDGRLQFLGGFDVTDYMGPVASPGSQEAFATALMAALEEVPWSEADLRGIPEGSTWMPVLRAAAAGRGLAVESAEDGVAPLIELDGSFEGYLASLPAKLRHELRRKERRLSEGAGYRIRLSTPESIREDLDRFLDLHRASPGPKGRFMHAGMEIFFRRLGETFLPEDRFLLAFLEIGGVKVAGAIGLAYGDTFSLYNSAFDRSFSHLSPGMVLVANLIREAAEGRRRRFDLLKGDLTYKYRFGADPRRIGGLVLRR